MATPRSISVEKLTNVFYIFACQDTDGFDTWGTHVDQENVHACIQNNILESTPYFVAQQNGINDYNHAARIAFLVLNRDDTPIEIDVGIPSMGCYDCSLVDGNHRAAAAIIRKDEKIKAFISGEVSYIRHLFVKPMKKYDFI